MILHIWDNRSLLYYYVLVWVCTVGIGYSDEVVNYAIAGDYKSGNSQAKILVLMMEGVIDIGP